LEGEIRKKGKVKSKKAKSQRLKVNWKDECGRIFYMSLILVKQ